MKRLQISLEPELDEELARLAGRAGISKAAMVRELVRERSSDLPRLEEDPFFRLIGTASGGHPDDSVNHDAIITDAEMASWGLSEPSSGE